MFKKLIFSAVISIVVLSSASAFAWDNSRTGFILGGGLGVGAVVWNQEVEIWGVSYGSSTESDFAFVTDFKIGYAPTDQIAIYYFEKTGWLSMENIWNQNVIIASGLGGIGASYYLSPQAPSLLVSGGLGLASWSAPFEAGDNPWYGFGLTVGAGYEFVPHIGVGFDFLWGQAQDGDSNINVTTNSYGFLFNINATGY